MTDVTETLGFPLISEQFLARDGGVFDAIERLRPSDPLHIIYPAILRARAEELLKLFSGTVMYAVKCNPDKHVLRTLYRAGIRTFDAASIDEVRLVRKIAPRARIHFMHTVKSREAIREAYFKHGVRVFVLDTLDELHKILAETDLAPDLELFVRLALPKNAAAAVDFSAKFGALPHDAVVLLREARLVASRLGLMFHAGTQSRDAAAFARGVRVAADVIRLSGVTVDALDVGGGFPAPYPGTPVVPLANYMDVIKSAIDAEGLSHLELFCEPGRALVAEAGTLVVRVELRRGNLLYLNDGVYGGLIEMLPHQGAFQYPVRAHTLQPEGLDNTALAPFRFGGPTCDSTDMMAGPFYLPDGIAEGDWIEIGLTGAYSVACRTNFNGFGRHKTLMIESE